MQFSSAASVVTKERYVSACQFLLLVAIVATVVIAVAGVARLDIVGPHGSTPANQMVHGNPGPTSHR